MSPASLVSALILAGTMVATLATAIIILKQASLLGEQNQVNVLVELQRDWESLRMHSLRSRWGANTADLDALEPILEFLEEFAGFRKRGVLNDELVWDTTIGWHAVHYYFYNAENGNIEKLRERWLDQSLFQNLEKELWPSYVGDESEQRATSEQKIKEEFSLTSQLFIDAEKKCNAYRLSQSSD